MSSSLQQSVERACLIHNPCSTLAPAASELTPSVPGSHVPEFALHSTVSELARLCSEQYLGLVAGGDQGGDVLKKRMIFLDSACSLLLEAGAKVRL